MEKISNKKTKDRMIHIRLDDTTHKHLKIKAVHQDTTVQSLVERLILASLTKSRGRDVR
ncbi:CopG family transcriptional regulator [Patescibacteria group bacterium]|nr:CopG family transcriptional regulator [Patescibacteria group bacterium]